MGGVQRSPFAPPAAKFKPAAAEAPRKPHGGHPATSPQASQAVLAALHAGESISAAARAGDVSRTAVRGIWTRAGGTWPPPGAGTGSGRGKPASVVVTAGQVAEALELRGERRPNGRWETPIPVIAAQLGVPVRALYRALERAGKVTSGSEEER